MPCRCSASRRRVGRGFAAEEDLPGQPAVVVLSDGLWRRRFGADPEIVGRTLIAGRCARPPYSASCRRDSSCRRIMPDAGMELWTLLQLDPAVDRSERGWHWLTAIGPPPSRSGMAEGAEREMASLMAGMLATLSQRIRRGLQRHRLRPPPRSWWATSRR